MALTKEVADMKRCVYDLEAELTSAQHDLKEVVNGDLQLGSALAEIKRLRARLTQVQADKLQAALEVTILMSCTHCTSPAH